MAKISRFQDIESWRKARELTREIYRVSAQGSFARDYALLNQIRAAAISIMSNIAEGFGRSGNREFIQFLSNAKGSAAEVHSQLYIALDAKHLTEQEFQELTKLVETTMALVGGLIMYLRQSEYRGSKFPNPELRTVNREQRGTRA